MNNNDVLMILPKRTISHPSDFHQEWETDYDSSGVTVYTEDTLLGHANWSEGFEFGLSRPAIQVYLNQDSDELPLFEAMISRLAIAYEMMPSRYPLYIRIPKEHLSLIAKATHMGFVPYFGEWELSNSDQSQSDWEEITRQLKNKYPEGLKA